MAAQARQVTDSVSDLERAVLATVLYSDLFDYALTLDELAHYLIRLRAAVEDVRAALARSDWLRDRVSVAEGFVVIRGARGAGPAAARSLSYFPAAVDAGPALWARAGRAAVCALRRRYGRAGDGQLRGG